MEPSQLSWITNFLWGIADDVLRDLYVRGKYRDVILPMTVLRRLDSVLEPTKAEVLAMKARLDKAGVVHQDGALRGEAGQAFYNTSPFTLRDLKARAKQQQLRTDFEAYLDGFSPNVQDILDNFEFRNQIPRLSKADALGTLIEKFLAPDVNLGPNPVLHTDGSVRSPGLDNHGMGTIFEELVRRFNEDNNEEAGEHWTPRDAVKLMARLIFLPVADRIESSTYLLYDGACGTGGMLTVAEAGGRSHPEGDSRGETRGVRRPDRLDTGETSGAGVRPWIRREEHPSHDAVCRSLSRARNCRYAVATIGVEPSKGNYTSGESPPAGLLC
jgi:type I restriction enzyme M protein